MNFNDLSDDAISIIFGFFDAYQLGRIAEVCSTWHRISLEDSLWMAKCVEFGSDLSNMDPTPEPGTWKQYFVEEMRLSRFNANRCHDIIKILNKGKTVQVPSEGCDQGYKGVAVERRIPLGCKFAFEVKLTLSNEDGSDHISIGVANGKFNTQMNCSAGWGEENAGTGWYNSNGATYSFAECDGGTTISTFGNGDRVGFMLNRHKGKLTFYKNGEKLKPAIWRSLKYQTEELYPTLILMHSVEATIVQPSFIHGSIRH